MKPPGTAGQGEEEIALLSPPRFGLGFGIAGAVFYLGCVLTMASVPREKAVTFFNSLLHGLNVEPVLQDSVPLPEVILGIVTTFILGWIAGYLVAGFYNWGLKSRQDHAQDR